MTSKEVKVKTEVGTVLGAVVETGVMEVMGYSGEGVCWIGSKGRSWGGNESRVSGAEMKLLLDQALSKLLVLVLLWVVVMVVMVVMVLVLLVLVLVLVLLLLLLLLVQVQVLMLVLDLLLVLQTLSLRTDPPEHASVCANTARDRQGEGPGSEQKIHYRRLSNQLPSLERPPRLTEPRPRVRQSRRCRCCCHGICLRRSTRRRGRR